MPHSLYLGSGLVQPRLREFDEKNSAPVLPSSGQEEDASSSSSSISIEDDDDLLHKYRPSIHAIRSCLKYSIVECALSLLTFALFVNSAILIVAGASLSHSSDAADASLFEIHNLLSRTIAPAAGTIFALALLLSGTSAGIVCTIAGQMVSEGQLRLQVKPWVRRLMTRSISITPSIIIAGAVGKEGLSKALEGSQVALSIILPFVSAPLVWFTCRSQFMTVRDGGRGNGEVGSEEQEHVGQGINMRNHWVTATLAVLIWGVIVVMNVALLVLVGLGKS